MLTEGSRHKLKALALTSNVATNSPRGTPDVSDSELNDTHFDAIFYLCFDCQYNFAI